MKRRGVKPSDPYDWEKIPSGDNVQNMDTQPPTAPTTIARHSKLTTDNNQENIEPVDNKEVCFVFISLLICLLLSKFCRKVKPDVVVMRPRIQFL